MKGYITDEELAAYGATRICAICGYPVRHLNGCVNGCDRFDVAEEKKEAA